MPPPAPKTATLRDIEEDIARIDKKFDFKAVEFRSNAFLAIEWVEDNIGSLLIGCRESIDRPIPDPDGNQGGDVRPRSF